MIKSESKLIISHGGNMKIITVTLNPAFDIHCSCDGFAAGKENLTSVTRHDAGGKGVNTSRALAAGGKESRAVVAVGRENGDTYLKQLSAAGVDFTAVPIDGRIRENITVHSSGDAETRISFAGFTADKSLLSKALTAIGETNGDTIVCFAGKNPQGIDISDIKALIGKVKAAGARVSLDSSSFEIGDIIDVGAWLIKPNEEEVARYAKTSAGDTEGLIDFALETHKSGTENVMISLGGRGALLVCDEGVFAAEPPETDVISTVGAGDSAIAGFVAAFTEGKSKEECLCSAVAYGTAACLTPGTTPPRTDDIRRVLAEVSTRKLK